MIGAEAWIGFSLLMDFGNIKPKGITLFTYDVTANVRHLPDPVFKDTDHYFLFLPASEARKFSNKISRDANVRVSDKRNKAPWKTLEASFKQNDYFHLLNRGVRVLAENARKLTQQKDGVEGIEFIINANVKQGVLDGGHTLSLFEDGTRDEDRFALFIVTVGVPAEVTSAEMAEGLNSGVTVEDWTIASQAGDFEKIRSAMAMMKNQKKVTFDSLVEWKKDEKPDAELDPRDVIALIHPFVSETYPHEILDGKTDRRIIKSYEKRSAVIVEFRSNRAQYEALIPIMKELFVLADTISSTAKRLYNSPGNRKGGALRIIDNGKTFFPFLGIEGESSLPAAVLFPIYAAFRIFVTKNASGDVAWDREFAEIKNFWEAIGERLIVLLAEKADKQPSLNALGKDDEVWNDVLRFVTSEKQRVDQEREIDRLKAQLAKLQGSVAD